MKSSNLGYICEQLSTLVLAEHEGGAVKASSISAVEAAKSLGDDNSISLLLAGSGPSLSDAAKHAASCHPSVAQVFPTYGICFKWD